MRPFLFCLTLLGALFIAAVAGVGWWWLLGGGVRP